MTELGHIEPADLIAVTHDQAIEIANLRAQNKALVRIATASLARVAELETAKVEKVEPVDG